MFRPAVLLFAVLALSGLAAAPARATPVSAAELLDAKLDYTADFYVSSGAQGKFQGTVVHTPGRERREFETTMGHEALLLRRDSDEAVMMWPERKYYVSTSFSAISSMVGGFEEVMLERRKIGADMIAGEPCARFEVSGESDSGGSFHGRMWFTRDNILMKAVGTARWRGKETPVETGLLNLRRIKADPSAFVTPSDYQGLPIDLRKFGLR